MGFMSELHVTPAIAMARAKMNSKQSKIQKNVICFSHACAYISNSLNYTCLLSAHFSPLIAFFAFSKFCVLQNTKQQKEGEGKNDFQY